MKLAAHVPRPTSRTEVRRKPKSRSSLPFHREWSPNLSQGASEAPSVSTLEVGDAHDRLEQQANAIADRIMRMPEPSSSFPTPAISAPTPRASLIAGTEDERSSCEVEERMQRTSVGSELRRTCSSCEVEERLQRTCSACELETEELLRSSVDAGLNPGGARGGQVSADFHARLDGRRRSGGRPLPSQAREFLEPRLGVSLDEVRVHDDSAADELARGVNARAFAIGDDLFFARGELRTDSHSGMHLLAHEVTHTLQQRGENVDASAPLIRRAPPQHTDIVDLDAVLGQTTVADVDEDYTPPERGFELPWIQARNYTNRERALEQSIEYYFERLFSEWGKQGFFEEKHHRALLEEHDAIVGGIIEDAKAAVKEAARLDSELEQLIAELQQKSEASAAKDVGKKLEKERGALDHMWNKETYTGMRDTAAQAQKKLDNGWYDQMRRAAEKKGSEDRVAVWERIKRETQEVFLNEVMPKIEAQTAVVKQLEADIFGDTTERLAKTNEEYQTALVLLEEALVRVTDVGAKVERGGMQAKKWPKSRLARDQMKAVGVVILRPRSARITPPENIEKKVKSVFMNIRVKPLIRSLSVPELIETIEKIAKADPELMQPFLKDAILEFAGAPWRTAHGDWLDPRWLLYFLASEELDHITGARMVDGTKKRMKSIPKPFKNLLQSIKKMESTQALAYLVELRRTGGAALYPDFAWAATITQTQLYLRKEYYDELQALNNGKADPKYLKEDPFGRNVEFNKKSMDDATGEVPERWRVLIKKWMGKAYAAWRSEILGPSAKIDKKTEKNPDATEQVISESPNQTSTYTLKEAVCNEIAELTQRGCGRRLPGGLRQNADQYRRSRGGVRYITNASDLVPCRSIFWLTWSDTVPPSANRVRYHPDFKFRMEDGTKLGFLTNIESGAHYNYTLTPFKNPGSRQSLGTCWMGDDDCAVYRRINEGGETADDLDYANAYAEWETNKAEKMNEYEENKKKAEDKAAAWNEKHPTKPPKKARLPKEPKIKEFKAPSPRADSGWLKWMHQATVAFPPRGNKVITFEPEPRGNDRVSRLRERSVDELTNRWNVMIGIDKHDKPAPGVSRAVWELLEGDISGPEVEGARDVNTDAMIDLITPFLQPQAGSD
jgi:hypothetical protein